MFGCSRKKKYFTRTESCSETIIDEMMPRLYKPDVVMADIQRGDETLEFKLANVPSAEKLEKFVEDVK